MRESMVTRAGDEEAGERTVSEHAEHWAKAGTAGSICGRERTRASWRQTECGACADLLVVRQETSYLHRHLRQRLEVVICFTPHLNHARSHSFGTQSASTRGVTWWGISPSGELGCRSDNGVALSAGARACGERGWRHHTCVCVWACNRP